MVTSFIGVPIWLSTYPLEIANVITLPGDSAEVRPARELRPFTGSRVSGRHGLEV